jgi:hypothetical protein
MRRQGGRRPIEPLAMAARRHLTAAKIKSRPEMQTIRLLCALRVSALIALVATPAQGETVRVGRLLCSSSPRTLQDWSKTP